jgi:hypothetical protein
MTTLDKVQEIISIFELVYEDNVYLLNKLKELEQDIINNLNVDHEEI